MQIKDKVVAITGGARGIGKAIATAFAERGARIALVDLVPADLEAARSELAGRGVEVRAYAANVAKEDQVSAALDGVVADFGRLDVMVNNAGIIKDALLVKVKDGAVVGKMSLEQWQAVIDVNLTGVFLCGREAAERMIRLGHGGVIVNIASISKAGNAGQSNYSAAKAGVTALAVVWARELARFGIRAASIAPGFTRTDILVGHAARDARQDDRARAAQAARAARGGRTRGRVHRRERLLHRPQHRPRRRPEALTMHIDDTRAIITGGASGLGQAVAEDIVAAGGRVALLDVNATAGHALAASLGERASFIETDVTSEAAVNAAVAAAVQAMGGLNLAVNCAGVGWPKRMVGKDGPMPGEFFRKVIEINLVGTLLVCKAAAAAMQKNAPNADGERGVDRHDGLGGGVRRPDRPGRLRRLQGRRRRHDAAHGARARGLRHPRRDHRAGAVPHADDGGAAGRGAGVARQAGALPAAPRAPVGVRVARQASRGKPHAERRDHPSRRRDPHGAALIPPGPAPRARGARMTRAARPPSAAPEYEDR